MAPYKSLPAFDTPADLPGAFDEEGCIAFLEKFAEGVVPKTNFRLGVEKVYAAIYGRYSHIEGGVPDAISVFHELLEDQSLEGDVWRSWRHGWRHRHDDLLDPFVPCIGGFAMPAPTDSLTRKAKSNRFAAATGEGVQVGTATHARISPRENRVAGDDDGRETKGPSKRRRRSSGRPRASSELFGNCFSLSPGTLLRYLRNGASDSAHHGDSDEPSRRSPIHREVDNEIGQAHRSSWPIVREGVVTWGDIPADNTPVNDPNMTDLTTDTDRLPPNSEVTHSSRGKRRIGGGFRLLPRLNAFKKPKKNKQPPQQPDIQPTPPKSSIFGRLFHRKAKETPNAVPVPSQTSLTMEDSLEVPIATINGSTASLNARAITYSESGPVPDRVSQLIPAPQLPCGPNTGRFTLDGANDIDDDMSTGSSFRSRNASEQTLVPASPIQSPMQRAHIPNFGLDGAYDEDIPSPVRSPLDLNKALPPQPLQPRTMRLSTCRINTPSLTYSQEARFWPMTASTESSPEIGLSRTSSKQRFQRTARELVLPKNTDTHALTSHDFEIDRFRRSDGSKYDFHVPRRSPNTPLTFSSFANANPFLPNSNEIAHSSISPIEPSPSIPEPLKVPRGQRITQSQSEGQLYSPSLSHFDLSAFDSWPQPRPSISSGITLPSFGSRLFSREFDVDDEIDVPEIPAAFRTENNDSDRDGSGSRKRSQSPMKRIRGMIKSQSMKEGSDRHERYESPKKPGLRVWGDRIRHGFLTNTDLPSTISATDHAHKLSSSNPSRNKPLISIAPGIQAQITSELELIICVAANKYLKAESKLGHISALSLALTKDAWSAKNRPGVIEFLFDQTTQRELIVSNLSTLAIHGECGTDKRVLDTTLYNWKVMAREMSIRTHCAPDVVVNRHFRDSHKILEMVGADMKTFLTLQKVQRRGREAIRERDERVARERVERERAERVERSFARRRG